MPVNYFLSKTLFLSGIFAFASSVCELNFERHFFLLLAAAVFLFNFFRLHNNGYSLFLLICDYNFQALFRDPSQMAEMMQVAWRLEHLTSYKQSWTEKKKDLQSIFPKLRWEQQCAFSPTHLSKE
jgi:hypothetical protein